MEKPIFKIEERDGYDKLIITRGEYFAHIIKYKKILVYEIFNKGYDVAIIGYNDDGLFFCVIQTNEQFKITLHRVTIKPLEENEILIKNYNFNKDGVYFIYLGAGDKYYIFDMVGCFGYIETIKDKFNLHVYNKGSYFYLSKQLLDDILLNLLR